MPEACKLNNEAAFCIKNGEYEKAIKLLRQATKFIRTALTSSPSQDFIHRYNDNGAGFCRFLPYSGVSLDSCFLANITPPTTSRTEQNTTPNTNYYTVFSSPVLVNRAVSLGDSASVECLSYVVVYNLALAHHSMAMNYLDDSEHHLTQETARSYQKKAVLLYEKSHGLLTRASQKWDVPVLHSLAILCNLGHLHHVMGDEPKSRACYQNLLSMLFYIIERNGAAGGSSTSSTHQYEDNYLLTVGLLDRFLYNVMPLLQKGSVAAAA